MKLATSKYFFSPQICSKTPKNIFINIGSTLAKISGGAGLKVPFKSTRYEVHFLALLLSTRNSFDNCRFLRNTATSRPQKNYFYYLNKRKCLKALVIIMDIRHPLKEDDLTLINWCEANNLPLIVLLNKSDKLSKNKASREQLLAINELEGLSTKYFVLITSAKTKEGVNELIETMMGLLDE